MNHRRKLILCLLASCLIVTIGIPPILASAQPSSGTTNSSAPKAAPASPATTPTTPATTPTTTKSSAAPTAQDIAAAKASGKVWVNTESKVYHKSGRWYGETKQGKFMTESEAKAAGYKEAQR
jgi:hypothetical protein